MESDSSDNEESAKIAFADSETARKILKALDLQGIKTDSLETRVDATIEGGHTVEV